MSWDFSSEEVIVEKLESQQRTIFAFSKKIKDLEAKLSQSQAIYNSLIDGAARDTMRINELEKSLTPAKKIIRSLISSVLIEWGDDIGEARAFLDKLEEI